MKVKLKVNLRGAQKHAGGCNNDFKVDFCYPVAFTIILGPDAIRDGTKLSFERF